MAAVGGVCFCLRRNPTSSITESAGRRCPLPGVPEKKQKAIGKEEEEEEEEEKAEEEEEEEEEDGHFFKRRFFWLCAPPPWSYQRWPRRFSSVLLLVAIYTLAVDGIDRRPPSLSLSPPPWPFSSPTQRTVFQEKTKKAKTRKKKRRARHPPPFRRLTCPRIFKNPEECRWSSTTSNFQSCWRICPGQCKWLSLWWPLIE